MLNYLLTRYETFTIVLVSSKLSSLFFHGSLKNLKWYCISLLGTWVYQPCEHGKHLALCNFLIHMDKANFNLNERVMRVSWALNLLIWQKKEKEKCHKCEMSIITMTLLRLDYLVYSLGNRAITLHTETSLTNAKVTCVLKL